MSANRVENETRLAMLEKAIAEKTLRWPSRLRSTNGRPDPDSTSCRKNLAKARMRPMRTSCFSSKKSKRAGRVKALDQLLAMERERAKQFMMSQLQDDRLRNLIVQNRQLLESITKRLSETNLIKDFGGFEARMVAPPRVKKG